ncbi:hypothetical protein BH20ACT9_BH20ACT9_02640 [soil metagenome]
MATSARERSATRAEAARGPSRLRAAIWVGHVLLPMLGLWLMLARPVFDVTWEHHGAHFWLVAAIGAVSFALGLQVDRDARRNGDARIALVALTFQSSAGFLLLHALATPQVLLQDSNVGFMLAAPVGLLVAGVFAVASSRETVARDPQQGLRAQRRLRLVLAAVLLAWTVASLLGLPPLDTPMEAEQARGPMAVMTLAGVPLYVVAAVRFYRVHRRRPSVVLLSVITAFVLLAEALVNVTVARNWQASWWEWHVLLLFAYGFVAYSAHVQYRREGSRAGLFNSVALDETVQRLRQEYSSALDALVDAYEQGAERGVEPARRAIAVVTDRFDLTPGQAQVLERAAGALASERRLFERYMPPRVARALRGDEGLRELGGRVAELTVFYADLRGFTSFSESHDPPLVVQLLNRYFDVVVDALFEAEGTITAFVGDAVMAVFNAPSRQPDHALRAARAALAVQRAVQALAAGHPDWPRFGIGVNTGPALYGNVGGEQLRSITAIGDAVNVAARLQAQAGPDQVVAGPATVALLGPSAAVRPLGHIKVKGRVATVNAFLLTGLSEPRAAGSPGASATPRGT